jgi:hypothetical protein
MQIQPSAPLTLALLLVVLAGCQGHTLDTRTYSDEAVQWGQPVAGLQVGLGRRNYTPGTEPGRGQMYFTVQMRNVTGRSLSVLAPTKLRGTMPEKLAGDESICVTLTYDGAAGARPVVIKPEDKPVVQVMEPGREYPMELRLAPESFGLERFVPGRVVAAYSNRQSSIKYAAMNGEPTTGLWTGEARSGAVAVEASPTTQRQGGGETK